MQKLLSRKQIRLKNYNYTDNGYYFITIGSKNKENIFGEYKNTVGAPLVTEGNPEYSRRACARIELSIIGKIINRQWDDIKNQYNNIELGKYIIMPNHLHGILIINNRAEASAAPTISKIIRSFKSKSTMAYLNYLKQNDIRISVKIWQRSFHDHIIRNERSLKAARKYIFENPANWEQDI